MKRFSRFLPLIIVAALGVATTLFACAGQSRRASGKNSGSDAESGDSCGLADSSALRHRELLLQDSLQLIEADSATR